MGDLLNDFHGLAVSNLETIRDSGGVDTLSHELGGGSKESTGHDDDGGGTVTGFNILSLGDFDELKAERAHF